jgi:photosystem II stability/assembly factor-like uncharacterized protein
VVWAQCVTGLSSAVARSTNDGATFADASDHERDFARPLSNGAAFSAASATIAVVGYQQLYRTTDSGATYSRVPSPRGLEWWNYLGFTDSTHGVALGTFRGGNRLYYTVDGGASYHYVPIDPT